MLFDMDSSAALVLTRHVKITQGNIDNRHIYLTKAMDFFPEDVLGGPNKEHAASCVVRVRWGDEAVETDVVRKRNIFRRRGWVRRFFQASMIAAGDVIVLERFGPYDYRVSKTEICQASDDS